MNALQFPGGRGETHSVTEDVVIDSLSWNIATFFSHDHRKLHLPVESLGRLMMNHLSHMTDPRFGLLCEEHRMIRLLDIERPSSRAVVDVLSIIYAEHSDVFVS